MPRIFRPLDRYVFSEFWRVFLVTALGFPILVEVLDLAENLDRYVDRNLPRLDIALSYFYWLPESMFMVLPAAVLFATVFTIGSLTRHSEITAAKASGISFHRLILPIFVAAILATGIGLAIGELVPSWNQKRFALLREQQYAPRNDRSNFAFLAEDGRVYQMGYMRVQPPSATMIHIERLSVQPGIPNYITMARSAEWMPERGGWKLMDGVTTLLPDSTRSIVFTFDSLMDRGMRERPAELSSSGRAPSDMGYRELGRYIEVMERAGGDVNQVRVERMLKLVIPITCVIIVLFGAPLATSTRRGGASYGIGISLAATVLFLLMINLTKAFGKNGVLEPEMAAWLPSILFGVLGIIMLIRVRT